MQRTGAMQAPGNLPRKLFPAVLLLCLAVSGCGTTCVSGFWNGTTSGVNFSNTSCPLTKATGTVIMQMSTASAPPAASATFPPPLASRLASPSPSPDALLGALPNNIEHIFVALRGIEAHPDAVADEDSPAWQELAPGLAAHPVQLDLLDPLRLGDSQSQGSSANANVPATIPADEYRQLRLRLMPSNLSQDDAIPETNACGNVGWNCILFADHSTVSLEFATSESAAPSLRPMRFAHNQVESAEFVGASLQPVEFDAGPEFLIHSEPATGNLFRVLPGEVIQLSIDFDPASSVHFTSNAAVRLVPVFRIVSRHLSPAPTAQ